MIVKIKSHKRPAYRRLFEYLINDKDRLFDKEGWSFAVTHNLKGNSIDSWEKEFRENEKFRQRKRSDSVLIYHEILSWHRDDAKHISLAKMENMAREYIRQRNPKGMYLAVPHFDKDHYHIHICASGVEYKTGKSLRLSKPELLKLKRDIQEYQVEHFPELSKSIVAHGSKKTVRLTEKEYQIKLRTGRETEKEQVVAVLKTCYKKANSKETFFQLLKECGLKIYDRSGKMSGVIFKNYKFRFSRLGFTEERFNELEREGKREKGLIKIRNQETKEILISKG